MTFFQLPSEHCSWSVCLWLLGIKSTLHEFHHKGKIKVFSFECMDREVTLFSKETGSCEVIYEMFHILNCGF